MSKAAFEALSLLVGKSLDGGAPTPDEAKDGAAAGLAIAEQLVTDVHRIAAALESLAYYDAERFQIEQNERGR